MMMRRGEHSWFSKTKSNVHNICVDLPAQLSPNCSAITAILSSVLSMALIDAASYTCDQKKPQIGCFCFVSWFVSATTNILKLGTFISQKEHVWPNMWNWIGWFLPMAGSFRALYLSLRASGVKVRLRSSLPIIYQSSTQQWTWYNDLDKTHWQVLVIQVRG